MAKRTPEQWLELLQQHKQSRLTVAQFCRENHLSESNLTWSSKIDQPG